MSELEGLSLTVSSLERQLMDREADAEGLRRQLEAGGDRSLREKELSRQVLFVERVGSMHRAKLVGAWTSLGGWLW